MLDILHILTLKTKEMVCCFVKFAMTRNCIITINPFKSAADIFQIKEIDIYIFDLVHLF